MTISRPAQGSVANYARDIYCFNPLRCMFRARVTSCPNLGLRQQIVAQQQIKYFNSNKTAEFARALHRCQASRFIIQETQTIKVLLCFQHQVPFGQVLKVVGSGPKLGDWQSEDAQELKWNEGHVWTGEVNLEPGSYEFKCVVAAGGSIVAWEPGPNRILQVPNRVRGIRVDGSWSQTSDNRITVTEPIAAASVAARQKRAAAARLLAKALAEVNATAIPVGPSAAAVVAAGTGAVGSPATTGTVAGGSDQKSAAGILKVGVLQELRELFTPEPLSVEIRGARSAADQASSGNDKSGSDGGKRASDRLGQDKLQVVVPATPRHESISQTAAVAVAIGVKSGTSSSKGAAVFPVAAEGRDSTGRVTEGVQDDLGASVKSVEPHQKQQQPTAGRVSTSSLRDVLSISDGNRSDQREHQPWQQEEQQRPASAAAQKDASSEPAHFLILAENLEKHDAQQQALGGGLSAASGIAQSIREAAVARGEPVALRGDVKKVGPTCVPAAAEAAAGEAKGPVKQQLSSVAKSTVQTELANIAAAAKATAAVEVAFPTQKAPLQTYSSKQIDKGSSANTERPTSTEPVSNPLSKVAEVAVTQRGESDSRFAGIFQKFEDINVQSREASKVESKGKGSNSAEVPAVRDGSEVSSPSPTTVRDSDKSISEARRLSWRQLLDSDKPASSTADAQPKQQQQSRGVQDKASEGPLQEEEAKPSQDKLNPKEGEEGGEGVSSRFARLLASRLGGSEKRPEKSTEAVAVGTKSVLALAKESNGGQVERAAKQEKLQETSKSVKLEASAESVKVAAPETPPGRDIRSQGTTIASVTSATSVSLQEAATDCGSAGSGIGEVGGVDMGVGSSRAEPHGHGAESVTNPHLDRLLGAWDAAWSQSRHKQQPASEATILRPASDGSGGTGDEGAKAGLTVNQTSARDPVARAAVDPGTSGRANDRADSRAGPVTSALSKLANGGTAVGISSGESLFSLAERLTSGNALTPAPTGSSDESSPGITMRMGAMAAMGVDRQGSYDNRSSYLSHSLLTESLSGGGNQDQSAAALLRQLRNANTANTSAAADSAGTSAADDPAMVTASIPNLPATPAPPGILSSVDEDDNVDVAPPRLPATPPPPSYLAGMSGDGAGAPVPPLPATPVASSILSGGLGGVGVAADDLLRRAADADSLFDMLRGNLPLTPIARGGRVGAAGPLSMADEDGEEDGKNDQTDGSGASSRGRRKRRGPGTRLLPVLPIPGMPVDSRVDPVAAARAVAADAVQALDKTRAGLLALQQSAAGLGLTPEALSESAARLLQQLPKLDAPMSQPSASANVEGNGATSGSASLPPAVSQLATSLASGIGNVGSSLTEQLRKAGAAAATVVPGPTASLTEAANGVMADANANPAGAANGTASRSIGVNGNGAANPTAISSAAGGASLLTGLLGGFIGNMAPLPAGCVRLVAGAHMIPHVDKVEKGGEDAYFISRVGLGGVGVADGVSGWADEGIDPAEYPRTLMRYASDAYEAAQGTMSARDIIRYAQYRTYLKGSSTVCLALMKPGKKLEVANVGDSGVRILRNGKVIFGTEAQQHAFNMPYQLSHPNNVEDPDSADDADLHYVDVQEGDVIMLATDGLFDNVFDEEIEHIISQQLRELAAAGRGKAPSNGAVGVAPAPAMTSSNGTGEPAGGAAAATGTGAGGGSSGGGSSSGGGGAGSRGKGLLSQSFTAVAAAAAAAAYTGGVGAAAAAVGGSSSQYRPEDAARVARALAERAHLHARNPTQRTPWSVTSSQQPNFMWAKFFAKGGGKMDDCTVLVAFVCGPE